jgi:hypothetical protein
MTARRSPRRRPRPSGTPSCTMSLSRPSGPSLRRSPPRVTRPGAAMVSANRGGSQRTGRGAEVARTAAHNASSGTAGSERASTAVRTVSIALSTSARAADSGATRSQIALTTVTSDRTVDADVCSGGRSTTTGAPDSSTRTASTATRPSRPPETTPETGAWLPDARPSAADATAMSSNGIDSVTATPGVNTPIRSSAAPRRSPAHDERRTSTAPSRSTATDSTPSRCGLDSVIRPAAQTSTSAGSTASCTGANSPCAIADLAAIRSSRGCMDRA